MTHDNLNTANVGVATTEVTIGERLRWGPIVAGLFVALSTLILLSVLGAAIGLSTFDRGEDDPRIFGIGAGVWGAISMIIAFLVGGWLAARWSGSLTRHTSLLHGALVWAVAIPLSLFVLGSMGSALGGGAMANQDTTARADVMDNARTAGATIGDTAARTGDDQAETAKRRSAGAAWGTFISLLLGLGAAALGGYLGAHDYGDNRNRGGYGGAGVGGATT
jgi:hypothetical protein